MDFRHVSGFDPDVTAFLADGFSRGKLLQFMTGGIDQNPDMPIGRISPSTISTARNLALPGDDPIRKLTQVFAAFRVGKQEFKIGHGVALPLFQWQTDSVREDHRDAGVAQFLLLHRSGEGIVVARKAIALVDKDVTEALVSLRIGTQCK